MGSVLRANASSFGDAAGDTSAIIRFASGSSGSVIENVRLEGIDDKGPFYGILIDEANITVRSCFFNYFNKAVMVDSMDYARVERCRVQNQHDEGIEFLNSDYGMILDNMVLQSGSGSAKEIKVGGTSSKNLVLGNSCIGGTISIDNTSSHDNRSGYYTGGSSPYTGQSNHASMEITT